jgi:ATP-dependent protease ClpP protease subunit
VKAKLEITMKTDDCTTMMLQGDIGPSAGMISMGMFRGALASIKTPRVKLLINSPGGSFNHALDMCNAMKTHDGIVDTCVTGLAGSCASMIAAHGKNRSMLNGSWHIVHNPMADGDGENYLDAEKKAAFLKKQSAMVAEIYAKATGKSARTWQQAMDANNGEGSQLTPKECMEMGLCDRIGDPDEDDDDSDMRVSAAAYECAMTLASVPARIRESILANKIPQPEIPMKIIMRDGKFFTVDDNGVVLEADTSALALPEPAASAATPESEIQMRVDAARKQAADDAIKAERAYRSQFETIMSTNKIAGEQAAEFARDFYAMDIAMVEKSAKAIARANIAARANPVGEGIPGVGGQSGEGGEGDDETSAVRKEIAMRCKTDRSYLRRIARLESADEKIPAVKARIDQLAARRMRSQDDWKASRRARNATTLAGMMKANQTDEIPESDPVATLIKNYGGASMELDSIAMHTPRRMQPA